MRLEKLRGEEGQKELEKVKKLSELAEKGKTPTCGGECGFLFNAPSLPYAVARSHADGNRIHGGATCSPPPSPLHSSELGCSVQHLALAWLAANPNTSTVILGASKPEQIVDNLKALGVVPRLTPEILEKVEKILDNKPSPYVRRWFSSS